MRTYKSIRFLALAAFLLLTLSLCGGTVFAIDSPFNDAILEWCDHEYAYPCSAECIHCYKIRENVGDHTYDSNADPDCNLCGVTRGIATITTQPKTAYAVMGNAAKVTVKATGDGLKYAWYYKNAGKSSYSKSSVTGSSYSSTMSSSSKDRQVYVEVTDKYGNTVQSNKIYLREAVSITTQPKTSYTKMGSTAKATVKASGDDLTYTWYIKNAGKSSYSKSSVTKATYSVTMSSSSKGRMVYCVVTDKYGKTATSNKITLREAASITTQPKTSSAKMGSTAKLTVKASGDGLTYAWYYKNSGKSSFSKSSVKTASYSATMSSTSKNRQVYCVVTDKYGKTVTSSTVYLREAVSITTQPKTTYAKKGNTAKVTVKASGDSLTYTWYIKNSGASKYSKSSVTASSYSVKMSSTTKNRMVYCVVKDKYGNTVTSSKVTLREAASITTQPKTVTVKKNATAKVTVKASGDGLTYTWYIKNAGSSKYSKSSITSSSYSAKMTSSVKNRKVYCVVKDKYGNTVKTVEVTLKMK